MGDQEKLVLPGACEITDEVLDVIDAADACVIYQVDGNLRANEVQKLCACARALVDKIDGEGGWLDDDLPA